MSKAAIIFNTKDMESTILMDFLLFRGGMIKNKKNRTYKYQ